MKIAVVFSGQGSQYPGMGKSLYEANKESCAIFDSAPEYIRNLCFEGSAEELAQTSVTQPCVYTMTMAAYAALLNELKKIELTPSMVAGFSLGECAALTASGVYDYETGIKLVTNRGNWMQEAGGGKGSMVAALGTVDKVEECVKLAKPYGMIVAVNYNSPKQTVVSADFKALNAFENIAKEHHLRTVKLKVSGPFHSPIMAPAADKMKKALSNIPLSRPNIPLYANVTSHQITDNDYLPDLLSKQIMSPVLWEQSIRNMINDGADTFIEVGPGKTLCGLIAKIDRSVTILNTEDLESLKNTIEVLKSHKENLSC